MDRWSSSRGRTRFRLVVLALIAGVALAVLLLLRFGAGHPATITALGAGEARVASGREDAFSINGSVSGLYPGASLPLELTITNPHPFPIEVTSITTSVESPSAGCASTHLVVTQFEGSLTVPGSGSAKTTVTATLDAATPDACQGTVFSLHYSGTAVKP